MKKGTEKWGKRGGREQWERTLIQKPKPVRVRFVLYFHLVFERRKNVSKTPRRVFMLYLCVSELFFYPFNGSPDKDDKVRLVLSTKL